MELRRSITALTDARPPTAENAFTIRLDGVIHKGEETNIIIGQIAYWLTSAWVSVDDLLRMAESVP